MSGEERQELSDREAQVLDAILTEGSIAAAARSVGVSRQAVHQMKKRERFQRALKEALDVAIESSISRLRANSMDAVDTVLSIMRGNVAGQDARTRLQAAESVLARAGLAAYLDAEHAAPAQADAARRVAELYGLQGEPEPEPEPAESNVTPIRARVETDEP